MSLASTPPSSSPVSPRFSRPASSSRGRFGSSDLRESLIRNDRLHEADDGEEDVQPLSDEKEGRLEIIGSRDPSVGGFEEASNGNGDVNSSARSGVRKAHPKRLLKLFSNTSNDGGPTRVKPISKNESPRSERPVHSHRRGESAVANVAIIAGENDGTPSPTAQRMLKGKARPLSQASQQSSTIASSSGISRPSNELDKDRRAQRPNEVATSALDASHIVQLALNLSESRRLQRAPGPHASPGVSGNRLVSGGSLQLPKPRDGPSGNYGHRTSSMRQALEEHQRGYRNASPSSRNSKSPRRSGTVASLPPFLTSAQLELDSDVVFSPETQARAQRARNHFEVALQYRRLLQHLPPLRPPSHINKTRTERQYNPLQYIRNRRVRARERDRLEAKADGWDDIILVQNWVDAVEAKAHQQALVSGDVVALPEWFGRREAPPNEPEKTSDGDTNTPVSKNPKLPQHEWKYTPEDIIADAYWVEYGANKGLIEDRDGHRLYPPRRMQRSKENAQSRPNSRAPTSAEDPGSPVSWPTSKLHHSPHSADSDSEEDHLRSFAGSFPLKHRPGKVSRLLRSRRAPSSASETFSQSDDDATEGLARYRKHPRADNVGPLHRHMNQMLAREHRQSADDQHADGHKPRESIHERRHGISEEQQDSPHSSRGSPVYDSDFDASIDGRLAHRPLSRDSTRSSAGGRAIMDQKTIRSPVALDPIREQMSPPIIPEEKFAFPAMSEADREGDRAKSSNFVPKDAQTSHRHRLSNSVLTNIFRHKTQKGPVDVDDGLNTGVKSGSEPDLSTSTEPLAPPPAIRPPKNGRVNDLIRSASGTDLKRWSTGEIQLDMAVPQPGTNTNSREDQDTTYRRKLADSPVFLSRGQLSSRSERNSIANSHIAGDFSTELPVFSHERRRSTVDMTESDLSLRQHQEARRRRKKSLAQGAPYTQTSSPSAGQEFLERSRQLLPDEHLQAGSATRDSSLARSDSHIGPGMRNTKRDVKKQLRTPGGVGKAGLPMTGLGMVDLKSKDDDQESSKLSTVSKQSAVTRQDVAYVRALLITSGIKAAVIERGAATPREQVPRFLLESAKLTGNATPRVSRAQEHVAAAKMLSCSLEKTVDEFDSTADAFQNNICSHLHSRINDLRERVNQQLLSSVRGCGDDAETFTTKLTTTHTLSVKQVNDGIDVMLRSRRARLRWLRKSGFKMLEWFVVGFLWVIWLIVLVLRAFRALLYGGFRGVKWLVWMS